MLFDKKHILDHGIDVFYESCFMDPALANSLFADLVNEADWHRPEMKFGDKVAITRRQVAWHADEGYVYKYSGQEHTWKDWTSAMQAIRQLVYNRGLGEFNGVLLNYYADGNDYVSPHSDDEEDLIEGSPIVAVSLGETRDFVIKHKINGNKYVLPLENGSLVVMQGDTQKVSKHSIPKRKNVIAPRISLTFRRCSRKIDLYEDLL